MNEEFSDIQYAQIREYRYAQWFRGVQYKGKTLSESERQEFISIIDSTIAQYSEGLPLMTDILEDRDYDRRFMRGKLFVILNEGFKKLYGFNEQSQCRHEFFLAKRKNSTYHW